jgi:serine/threonine-protein kinase
LYRLGKLVRKHRTMVAAAAVVLIVALVAGGSVARERWRAVRQSEIAQAFGHEARDAEWLLKLAHCLPLHDLSVEHAEVRERMRRIEAEIERMGTLAVGPGKAALGRAAWELGDVEAAVEHLQTAWKSGYQGADVAYSLGLALAQRYQSERIRVEHLRDDELHKQRLDELAAAVRDPAIAMLQRGREARLGNAALAAALIAQLQDDHEAALDRLTEVARCWLRGAPRRRLLTPRERSSARRPTRRRQRRTGPRSCCCMVSATSGRLAGMPIRARSWWLVTS